MKTTKNLRTTNDMAEAYPQSKTAVPLGLRLTSFG